MAVTFNPHEWREATVHLDLDVFGAEATAGVHVEDLLDGSRYDWGEHNYVRLDPFARPAHVFHVTR